MTCLRDHEQGADLLIGYLEGTLLPDERRAIDQHALICADCRALLEVQDTLDDFTAPEVSADFDARLYARIAQEETAASWWLRFGAQAKRWVWYPAVPVAVAAALVAGVLWMREPAPATPQIDPQQLEQALQDLELLMPVADDI